MEYRKIKQIVINGETFRIDGDDAYEVAVAEGFKGTRAEWLDWLAEEANQKASAYADQAGGYASEADTSRAQAEAERLKAEQASKEAEEHTIDHVHKWLEDHPEVTTTVQDKSLTDAKFTEDLKNKTVKEYVTPEMFGYKPWGDSYEDATVFIQAAIDTGKPCYLYGHYNIKQPLKMIGDKLKLYIEGNLTVKGECGIIVTGSRNVVGGNGEIFVLTNDDTGHDTVTAVKLVLGVSCVENEISVKRITQNPNSNTTGKGYPNTNIGVEITGSETLGNGYFNKITSAIHFFNKGIWCHRTEGQHPDTWNTTTFIDAVINGCVQAVVFDWMGDGSFLRGSIQPCGNGHPILPPNFDVNTPLVKLTTLWHVDTFLWDLGKDGKANQSANLYAIEVTGRYCNIYGNVKREFFIIPVAYENTTYLNGHVAGKKFGVITRTEYGMDSIASFDNTNDVLLNCLGNPNITAKLATSTDEQGNEIYNTITEAWTGHRALFDGANVEGGFVYSTATPWRTYTWLFEFSSPKAIRAVAVWGGRLPKAITVEAETTDAPGVFVEVGTITSGVDYIRENRGQYNVASLVFDRKMIVTTQGGTPNPDDPANPFANLDGRKIKALKLKFDVSDLQEGEAAAIARISAFDVAPQMNNFFEGDAKFTGSASFAGNVTLLGSLTLGGAYSAIYINSPSGKKFKVYVDDNGVLTTKGV